MKVIRATVEFPGDTHEALFALPPDWDDMTDSQQEDMLTSIAVNEQNNIAPSGARHRKSFLEKGTTVYDPILRVSLPADDNDDAEATGQYAVRVARHLANLLTDDDQAREEAIAGLKPLLAPTGPMSGHSATAWLRLRTWLTDCRSLTTMELIGDSWDHVPPRHVDRDWRDLLTLNL